MQRELLGLMRSLFGDCMLRTVLKDSAEIDNASARLMTVYELEGPVTSRETYQRCLTYLNGRERGDRDADPPDMAEPGRAAARGGGAVTGRGGGGTDCRPATGN